MIGKTIVLALIVAALASTFTVPLVAHASAIIGDPSAVVIPWGDWLEALLKASSVILVALVSRLVHFAPPLAQAFLTDDAVKRYVDYAVGVTAGAAHGKTSSVVVTNEILGIAARAIIADEPKIAAWMGSSLRPILFARLAAIGIVPPEADSTNIDLGPAAGGG